MKKLIFVFGLMLTMIACGGNSTNQTENTTDSVVDSLLIDTIDFD